MASPPGTQAQRFRVLDTSVVTPDDGPPSACSVPLTFFDVKWLHHAPVERVLLYRLDVDAADAVLAAILPALKDALSRALRSFYPLAGHVRLVPGRADIRHELIYRPGDGVHFTVAEYDVDLDELVSDCPLPLSAFTPLTPPLPAGRAVLAAQATVLRRGGGVALGVTVHHTACDGPGSTHFLHAWAAAARGKAAEEVDLDPPVIDRTLVPDPRGLYDRYLRDMPPVARSPDLEFVRRTPPPPDADVAVATFNLTEDTLQRIKSAVADEEARRGRALPRRCSNLVAAYGFLWWCHCHAAHNSDGDNDMRSHFYFLLSVDQRARMKPAVPDRYLGNCMCPAIAKAPRDELLLGGASSSLYAACAAVAAAIEEEVGAGAQSERWDGCVARVKDAAAHGLLSVGGSPRFRVYDMDFGFGRPAKVHMTSALKTGAVSVADARGGGRDLELGVALPPDAMDRFRTCFKDAMDTLRK